MIVWAPIWTKVTTHVVQKTEDCSLIWSWNKANLWSVSSDLRECLFSSKTASFGLFWSSGFTQFVVFMWLFGGILWIKINTCRSCWRSQSTKTRENHAGQVSSEWPIPVGSSDYRPQGIIVLDYEGQRVRSHAGLLLWLVKNGLLFWGRYLK